ncbi:MAG: taurine dioxygenase [Bacteroidota bacterium]
MAEKNNIVDFSTLNEMLYGETQYIKEFAQAAIVSFQEFKTNYTTHLRAGDETNFRKAGHKIKPVAQMLGIDRVIENYEEAKNNLMGEGDQNDRENMIAEIEALCGRVVEELQEIVENA